jgi:hypothetical protein
MLSRVWVRSTARPVFDSIKVREKCRLRFEGLCFEARQPIYPAMFGLMLLVSVIVDVSADQN